MDESPNTPQRVDMKLYRIPTSYRPGGTRLKRAVWVLVNALIMQNPAVILSRLRTHVVRAFGGNLGESVWFFPGVNIKYPWKLTIADKSVVGENVWLDTVHEITLGSNVTVSQGVYFCTGNHDWSDPAFGFTGAPIVVEDGVWIGARATILPGVTLHSHCVISAGSVVTKSTEPYMVYAGNPAVPIKKRVIRAPSESAHNA